MGDTMIVKVQQSIAGNAGKTVLIYNADRSVMRESRVAREIEPWLARLRGQRGETLLKAYFRATVDHETGAITLGARVEDQPW